MRNKQKDDIRITFLEHTSYDYSDRRRLAESITNLVFRNNKPTNMNKLLKTDLKVSSKMYRDRIANCTTTEELSETLSRCSVNVLKRIKESLVKSLKEREYVDDVYTVTSEESMNMEDDLRGIYVDDSLDALEDELSAEGFEYYDEGICIAPADCLYRIWKNDKYKILIYFGNDDNIVYNIYVKEKDNMKEGVEIEVKHEGILEVPEGKNVEDLPIKHFVDLAKKKGLSKITKALNNLQVWNKKKNPSLSKWAGDMIDKVSKRMEKKESWYPRVPSGYSWRTIAIPNDDDIEAEVEELLVDYKSSDDRIEWDIDYNGGVFGDDRVISIYSDGDVYTELKYKVSDMWDSYNYDLSESLKLKESGMYDYYDTQIMNMQHL